MKTSRKDRLYPLHAASATSSSDASADLNKHDDFATHKIIAR